MAWYFFEPLDSAKFDQANYFVKAKENCRCDNFLSILKDLNDDLHYKLKSNLMNGTLSSRALKAHKNHRKSRSKKVLFENCGDKFNFIDGHQVTRKCETMCCKSVCRFCNICHHMFECTCYEYNISSEICIHVHSAAQTMDKLPKYEIDTLYLIK